MARFLEIALEKRGASARARLLDDLAPRTAAAVWDVLPLSGDVFHAKYARNEVYIFLPPFATVEPGLENSTITPIPGDVCYFAIPAGQYPPAFREAQGVTDLDLIIDLAIFYDRNNLLLSPDTGWIPGTVFATIEEGLDDLAAACQDVWRAGGVGERLSFRRAEEVA